jgi:hypothetical protein
MGRVSTLLCTLALGGCVAKRGDAGIAETRVALVCDEAPAPSDHPDAVPDCDAVVVAADGTAAALGRGGLIGAARFDASRLLLHTRDLRVLLRDADGSEREIAAAVADPRVGDAGRVVWTELPPGTTAYEPGLPGTIVLVDLARGTRRVVTRDPEASAPFVVPGSDDVLFVSARTGVASLWLASPGRPERQLTNLGVESARDPRFVPVPGRELEWESPRVARFVARYGGEASTWRVDVVTGEVWR